MTAVELIQLASHFVFLVLAVITVLQLASRPDRTRLDTALFFGAIATAILRGRVEGAVGPLHPAIGDVTTVLVMALPYLLLRLLDDFGGVPRTVSAAAIAGLAVSAAGIFALPSELPGAFTLWLVAYFVIVSVYASLGFARLARTTPGVTKRRMQAVGLGTAMLAGAILIAGILVVIPGASAVTPGVTQALALVSALLYFAGFATPDWLRRFWREPELRAFLAEAAELPRLADTSTIVGEIERHVGQSVGARAAIGLWDEHAGVLRFGHLHDALPDEIGPSTFTSWRVFETQQPAYVPDAAAADPERAAAFRAAGIGALLVAPITAGERRLGVLIAYANTPPVFADEGLAYVQLLADQAAVVLESRALIDEAARVRAAEEATRMKEDFISAAAHDLKTPLTALLGQAQLLERRFRADPARAEDRAAVDRMIRTSTQLADLIQDVLEASRLEQGRTDMHAEPIDLLGLAADTVSRQAAADGRVRVDGREAVVVDADPQLMKQVLRNLIENALKYSPGGTPVTVRVGVDGDEGRITVEDEGIGIPKADMPDLFSRFKRASNVDERRFAGMGLGLYICKGIVERHRGRIWAESELDRGSKFHIALPLSVTRAG